jgi:PAS domain S-box-containing protein
MTESQFPKEAADLHQQVEELRKIEETLRPIIDNMSDLIRLVDLQGTILYASSSHLAALGYQPEEVVGKSSFDFVHPEDIENVFQVFSEAVAKKHPAKVEYRVKHAKGHYVWFETAGGFLRNDKGKVSGILTTSRNVTERKRIEEELKQHSDHLRQMVQECTVELQTTKDQLQQEIDVHKRTEEALRESEERYRVLFEGSVHGILAVDLELGRFIYANPSICRMLGYSETEFRQLGIEDIHPEDSLDLVKTAFEFQKQGKKALASELPCLRKDGTVFYADITGSATIIHGRECLVGFFADVTERKQAEEALGKSEERYRTILEDIDEGYFEIDLAGNFTFVNDAECRDLGYSREELIGMNYRRYSDEATAKKAYELYSNIYKTGKPIKRILGQYISKDGRRKFNEVSASLVLDAKRKPIGFRGISQDVTDRERAEENIRALNKELQARLQELAETKSLEEDAKQVKSEFLSNISHELTTPLNSIIGFSQVLLTKNFGDLNEKQRGYLENILNSGERLHDTLKNIVSFVCMDVRNPDMDWEDFRLKDIVTAALSVFRKAAIDRHLTLTLKLGKEANRLIRADRGKLIQVFYSLLSNAVKFTPDGGSVRISARKVNSEQVLVNSTQKLFPDDHSLTTDTDFMEICVADTGIGIKEEDLPRLFRIFEQLEVPLTKQYEGVGMGLVLSRKIIEAHGGAIRVESELGQGTKVIVSIPVRGRGDSEA